MESKKEADESKAALDELTASAQEMGMYDNPPGPRTPQDRDKFVRKTSESLNELGHIAAGRLIEEQHHTNEKLKEALRAIIKHQEISAPTLPQFSATWRIATEALKERE